MNSKLDSEEHLEELLFGMSLWNDKKYRDYYFLELLPKMFASFDKTVGIDDKERELLMKIKSHNIGVKGLMKLVFLIINNYLNKRKIIEDLLAKVTRGKLKPSSQLAREYRGAVDKATLRLLRLAYDEQLGNRITLLIDKGEFAGVQCLIDDIIYEECRSKILETRDKAIKKNNEVIENNAFNIAKSYLEKGDILVADNFMRSKSYFNDRYKADRKMFIKVYFNEKLNIDLDDDKISAIADDNKYQIVKARAGSGKTSFLAYKAKFLVDKYSIKPSELLVLTFNKDAAGEMRKRFNELELKDSSNVMTFHSLAYKLVQPDKILFDESSESCTRKQSLLIQDIVEEELKKDKFCNTIYRFFRKEIDEAETDLIFKEMDEKIKMFYLKRLRQISLGSDVVKSRGEKFIADFLFEHGLNYQYEKTFKWDNKNYKPDFVVLNEDGEEIVVIEYWGMKKSSDKIQRDNYEAEIIRKKAFWQEKAVPLVEIEFEEINKGRVIFEEIIRNKLAEHLPLVKLSEDQVIEKVNIKSVTHFTKLVLQYIQKAKKAELSYHDLAKKIEAFSLPFRINIFSKFSNHIYDLYEKKLTSTNKLDYDDLVKQSTEKILKYDKSSENNENSLNLQNVKYIFIDEYQDFSTLFYKLIDSIRTINPMVSVICVGDDWQAINSFAGSDLLFFEKFDRYFENASVNYLLNNYRSSSEIVNCGNKLMQGLGRQSEVTANASLGTVSFTAVDDTYVNEDDIKKIGFETRYPNYLLLRYMKTCAKIIQKTGDDKVMILARTKRILTYYDLGYVKKKLDKYLGLRTNSDKISVSTVHSAKGLEADIIIILEASNEKFPLIHPDNNLFEIFGYGIDKVLAEERRLFYVAITRAKKGLYILHEKQNCTTYQEDLKR